MTRLLILVLVLLGLDTYCFQAFIVVFEDAEGLAKIIPYGLYWLFSAIILFYVILLFFRIADHWKNPVTFILRTLTFILILSQIVVMFVLLGDDIRRGILGLINLFTDSGFNTGRSEIIARVALFAGAVPLLSLAYGIFRNPYRYKIFRETISLPEWPKELDGLKIVQISDIHSGSFFRKEPIQKGIDLILSESPDLVLFTGDLVNYKADEVVPYLDLFRQIKATYGVYSILGNHDYGDYVRWPDLLSKQQNLKQLMEYQKKMNWHLLANESMVVEIKGEKLAILGVENFSANRRFTKYGDLEKTHLEVKDIAQKILLSHDPTHWDYEVIRKYKDIAITFSGHTHGMQFGVEIPGFIKWSPIQYVYRKWAGLYQEGQQYLYVNRGFGFLGYPGRVGILPEITSIEIKTEEAR